MNENRGLAKQSRFGNFFYYYRGSVRLIGKKIAEAKTDGGDEENKDEKNDVALVRF